MAFYLMQHEKSLPKDVDPELSLSDEGVSDVGLISGVAANYPVRVDEIFYAGKSERFRQPPS